MEKALIDTSILIEPFTPWKNNEPNYKLASLSLLRGRLHTFRKSIAPVISIGVMGEFNLIVNRKETIIKGMNVEKRDQMTRIIQSFFNNCEMVGLSKGTIEMCNKILSLDKRIDPLDALHLSTAINENCRNIILIDQTILENIKIKNLCKENELNLINFGIKKNMDIKRPNKDFLSQV